MGSRALLLVKEVSSSLLPKNQFLPNFNSHRKFAQVLHRRRSFSAATTAGSPPLEALDVPRLAETARISLTPQEVEEFAPKIGQVMEWFGQLQAVDLESVEPSIRADTEGDNFRADVPETFENRNAIIAAIPNYEEPYIKVPKVLNKE
ncbi:putative asparaginyl-tRNA synthase (glutamine-hydrolyzing) [Rosa chinensis]|uniref:Glutamyl-tRNA(Gln) amidotransferase subunit C, chloroplastic/mitochondrial n=1 Tax=Rosa chinensis TaxID=74649 RepID=A0A2P6Q070_ROSCH|nr:glutamyl-tRNA(Gln) amidotransferase subunit C, chloroplastic/mitochondrial [Rosa chinensis]PRQ27584.1 putative asparaginyl-tRNA synthase (glutamine-hydrolyzing) [Rosa chinensis]